MTDPDRAMDLDSLGLDITMALGGSTGNLDKYSSSGSMALRHSRSQVADQTLVIHTALDSSGSHSHQQESCMLKSKGCAFTGLGRFDLAPC